MFPKPPHATDSEGYQWLIVQKSCRIKKITLSFLLHRRSSIRSSKANSVLKLCPNPGWLFSPPTKWKYYTDAQYYPSPAPCSQRRYSDENNKTLHPCFVPQKGVTTASLRAGNTSYHSKMCSTTLQIYLAQLALTAKRGRSQEVQTDHLQA